MNVPKIHGILILSIFKFGSGSSVNAFSAYQKQSSFLSDPHHYVSKKISHITPFAIGTHLDF